MSQIEFSFDAIGTKWVIDHLPRLDARVAGFLETQIKSLVADFDEHYSRFREDSDVTLWAHEKGEYEMLPDLFQMLSLYKKLYDLTGGAFTPLIGSVMEDAGYDASYSLKPKDQLFKPYEWNEVIDFDEKHLAIKKPGLLDFGALGKGKIIDIVGAYFEKQGITSYCIDAGGDLLYHDPLTPIRIGLEHPEELSQVIGEIEIKDQSICASSGNRRKWGEYHHIIDPRTLSSSNHILASWVVAKDAMTADGLATALFLAEPEIFEKEFSFSYLLLYPDYSIKKSADFPAQMYYTKS